MKMPFRMSFMPSLLFAALVSLTGCDVINLKGREPGEIPFKLVGADTGGMSNDNGIGQQRWNIDYLVFTLASQKCALMGSGSGLFKQTQWQTPNIALLKFHNKCNNPDDANSTVLDVSEELLKLSTNLRFTMGLPSTIITLTRLHSLRYE